MKEFSENHLKVIIDLNGFIIFIENSEVFKYNDIDCIGKSMNIFLPPDFHEGHEKILERFKERMEHETTFSNDNLGKNRVLTFVNADKSLSYINLKILLIYMNGQKYVKAYV